MFDHYIVNISIKANKIVKRIGKRKPVQKLITGPDVRLQQVWISLSLWLKKADLACYLSNELRSSRDELP